MIAALAERCRRIWRSMACAASNAVLRVNSFILIGMTGATVLVGIDLVALAVFAPVASGLIVAASVVWGFLAVRRRWAGKPGTQWWSRR